MSSVATSWIVEPFEQYIVRIVDYEINAKFRGPVGFAAYSSLRCNSGTSSGTKQQSGLNWAVSGCVQGKSLSRLGVPLEKRDDSPRTARVRPSILTRSHLSGHGGRITGIHVSLCQQKSTSFPYALWRARCASDQDRLQRAFASRRLVPALCRTGHPFVASGSGEPSQKIEFGFSASPETIRREPRESPPSPSR